MFFKAASQHRIGMLAETGSRQYHDVDRRQRMLRQAKTFANRALDSMARNRIAGGPGRDYQPQAGVILLVTSGKHGKQLVR